MTQLKVTLRFIGHLVVGFIIGFILSYLAISAYYLLTDSSKTEKETVKFPGESALQVKTSTSTWNGEQHELQPAAGYRVLYNGNLVEQGHPSLQGKGTIKVN